MGENQVKENEIKKFIIDYDTSIYLCILVLNGKGEYECRSFFYDNLAKIIEKDDQKIVALSNPNWEYSRDICDNCEHDSQNQNGDWECAECKNKIDCIIDAIQAEQDYLEDLLEKVQKDL